MTTLPQIQLGSLKDSMDRVPYSITLSDLSLPDQPLIYMNPAFMELTGCTEQHLGKNCRFLQADLNNETARAEIRNALEQGETCQTLLRNRRISGEVFYNLLLLHPIGAVGSFANLAVGAQYELTLQEATPLLEEVEDAAEWYTDAGKMSDVALRLRLDQRRIIADSAVRMVKSWGIMETVSRASTRDRSS